MRQLWAMILAGAAVLYPSAGQAQVTDEPSSSSSVTTATIGKYTLFGVGAVATIGAGYYYARTLSFGGDADDSKADCERGVYGSCWRFEGATGKAEVADTNAAVLLTLGLSSLAGAGLMMVEAEGQRSDGKRLTLELVYGAATAATLVAGVGAVSMLAEYGTTLDAWERCSTGPSDACDRASATARDHADAGKLTAYLALGGLGLSLGGAALELAWPNEVTRSARLVPLAGAGFQGAALAGEF